MSGLGYALGAGISALGSLGNTFLSSYLGNKSSKKSQARAYRYWQSSLKEGPELTRQGLEAAGYNPMLALGSVGGQAFSANSSPSFAPVGDVVGSAKQGAELANLIEKGYKLQNKKLEKEIENLDSDLSTKEAQRLQTESNTSLLRSQTDRTDLAYGRDIVDTAASVAGTVGSLYSAKAMRDIARSPKETVTTIHHGDKTKPTEIIKSKGVPSVDSSAKGSRPSPVPHVGSSAKSAGRAVKSVARRILADPLMLPLILTGAAASEYATPEGRKRQGDHYRRNWENNKYFSPLR